MNSAIAVRSGAIGGAAITAIAALLNSHRQRRSEIDARIFAAAFNFVAMEWRGHINVALQDGSAVLPSIVYLFQALKIARILGRNDLLDAAVLERIAQETDELGAQMIAIDERRRIDAQRREH